MSIKETDAALGFTSPKFANNSENETFWYVWYQDVFTHQLFEAVVKQKSVYLYLDVKVLEDELNRDFDNTNTLDLNPVRKINAPVPTGISNTNLPIPISIDLEFGVSIVSGGRSWFKETGKLTVDRIVRERLLNSVSVNYYLLFAVSKGINQAIVKQDINVVTQLFADSLGTTVDKITLDMIIDKNIVDVSNNWEGFPNNIDGSNVIIFDFEQEIARKANLDKLTAQYNNITKILNLFDTNFNLYLYNVAPTLNTPKDSKGQYKVAATLGDQSIVTAGLYRVISYTQMVLTDAQIASINENINDVNNPFAVSRLKSLQTPTSVIGRYTILV